MAPIIIGEGSERDPRSIPMTTRDGSHIPNFRRPEDSPEMRRGAANTLKVEHGNAKLRSSSSTYNCVGHLFASRRTWVESDHLPAILERDGYSRVDDPSKLCVGDIVVYENAHGEITHVGQVVEMQPNLLDGGRKVIILSKWGVYGEYLHELLDVPLLLGRPRNFWTERREV
jgi:hypothetical protein